MSREFTFKGEFGVRLEDDMHITENGAELFTPQSPSLEDPFGSVNIDSRTVNLSEGALGETLTELPFFAPNRVSLSRHLRGSDSPAPADNR